MSDIDDDAQRLIEAALGGDSQALRAVSAALAEAEEVDESDAPPTRLAKITVYRNASETPEHAVADALLEPTTQAGLSSFYLAHYGKTLADQALTVDELTRSLQEQVKAVNEKRLGRGGAMLTAQAHTLDALFNALLRKAVSTDRLDLLEAFMKYALRAQSQCRATWEAISAVQNPPLAGYVGQANIAQGHQQVNNGGRSVRTRAWRKGDQPTEVLEHAHDGK